MARNLFDELQRIIDDQAGPRPGRVDNLHGIIAEVAQAPATPSQQSWYVAAADVPKQPTFREFLDALTVQRLPIDEVAALDGVVTYPEIGAIPRGRALLFLTAAKLSAATSIPFTAYGAGHDFVLYVNGQ